MSNGSSGADPEKPNKQPIADRIAEVLIDTEFYPLVLIGKGIKRFGPWIVVAFLLGVAFTSLYSRIIGKYLSSLCKLDHVIAPKEGFEAQL